MTTMTSDAATRAKHHATDLRQCSLYAQDIGPHIEKAMLDAANFLESLSTDPGANPLREVNVVIETKLSETPVSSHGGPARSVEWTLLLNGVIIDRDSARYSWRFNARPEDYPPPDDLVRKSENLRRAFAGTQS